LPIANPGLSALSGERIGEQFGEQFSGARPSPAARHPSQP